MRKRWAVECVWVMLVVSCTLPSCSGRAEQKDASSKKGEKLIVQAMSADEARGIAEKRARAEGMDLRRYDVTAESDEDGWRFHFQDPHAEVRGGDAHFSILVKADGKAELYGGW